MEEGENRPSERRYPRAHTSPWFFVVLMVVTAVIIVAGVFKLEPLAKVVQWLAVVL